MSRPSVDQWIRETTGAKNGEELRVFQMKRLRDTLRYAKANSAFYFERLRDICPETACLSALPFTYPEDIARWAHKMLSVPQGAVSRVVSFQTSGTTDAQKRVFFSDADLNATVRFFHHGMREFTRPGDSVLILFPCGKPGSIGDLLSKGLKKFGAKPVAFGLVRDFDELVRFVSGREINVIAGLPRSILELSRLCRPNAVNGLHSVLLSADYAAQSLCKSIEKDLNCKVYEHYGMTETCFGGGVYSIDRDGYHMRHNDFLYEIIEPDSGIAVLEGETGEITVTSLLQGAMPLIRYRTGDMARFVKTASPYPVLGKLCPRESGLVLKNGRTLSVRMMDEVLYTNTKILDYTLSADGDTLLLAVRSLQYDAHEIRSLLQDSPMGPALSQIDLRICRADKSSLPANTMEKRRITDAPL